MQIAVATSDGKIIDQHFGSASKIVIYDTDLQSIARTVEFSGTAQCSCGNGNENIEARLEAVYDCKYIIASRIGSRLQRFFEHQNQKFFEMPDCNVDYVVNKIVQYNNKKER